MSLVCDGSTDNSHIEAELTYDLYCHQWSSNVHFVGVKNTAKGDAQVIEVAMSTLFTDYFAGPWEKKIMGTGTDGASTIMGKNNGFVTKLRQRLHKPELVAVHCSAYRDELAYKDAARGIQLYKKVDALLLSFYFFYRNSPLTRSSLKQTFDALGETHRIPSRVGGTRCVPHISRAVSNVLKRLVTHLS